MTEYGAGGRSDLDVVRAALGEDYDVLDELGRGGMAIVYRARERTLDRDVAIKILPSQFAFDESFVERFQREGRIAAQLEHPHIVPIYRVGRRGHVIYLVMKYLRGQSLSDRLRAEGTLPAAEVRRILTESGSALGYAAKRGVVHRDIKPDNIMLDEEGRCVLTDFGIARSAAESKLTATGMSVGTPRYMSPEQARAKELDGRSDIYSLGIVGYECLAGTTPFDGNDAFAILMEHVQSPVPVPALRTAEERALFAVIDRMLAKDPGDRFQSADELIAALNGGAVPSGRGGTLGGRSSSAATTVWGSVADTTSGASDSSGPQSSQALDRALQAGIELVKRQQPKVGAGVAAGRRMWDAQRPRAAGAMAAAAAVAERVRRYSRIHRRRFRAALLATVTLGVGGYYSLHFGVMHRSRCPAVAPDVVDTARGGAPATPTKARPFTLVLDAVGSERRGADAEFYYDVCGLDRGAEYRTTLSVVRNQSGFQRMLGGVQPIRQSFDERAKGPATRRHRSIDLGNLPAGSYTASVVVTDGKGRRREKTSAFSIR